MHVERLTPSAFGDLARTLLLAREAEHSVMLGLIPRLIRDPEFYGHDPYLGVAVADGKVVGAAIRTPRHGVLLAGTDDARAIEALASDLHEFYGELPGVVGPAAAVGRFLERWRSLTGARARIAVAERAFRASSVVHPVEVPGRSRPYRDDDWALVLSWFTAFEEEALPVPSPVAPATSLEQRLSDPDAGLVVWEDVVPVSVAGYSGPTPNGIRIGPVYTPPEFRARGYASALVATVTASLLEGGRRFCFLFTDLANPTSNSVYERVGYEPVADVNWWVFE